MNEPFDTTEDSSAAAHQSSLGEMIRAARELREIGVEDLAQRLRLEPRKLRQLEQDQFDHVGPPAYVRGYLRSIAKELEVDDSALLAAYAQRAGGEPQLVDFSSRPPVQISSDSQIIRYTTIGIVVVMLVLVVLWWRSNVADETPVPAASQPDHASSLPPAPLPQGQIAADEFELVLEHGAPAEAVATPAPLPAADNAPASAAAAADGDVSEPAQDAISLSASADAWIEVNDSTGARLYYGMLREGRSVDLAGARPYTLVIGNAAVVSLVFRDKNIDLGPHSDEGVARLTVGEAAAP